MGILTRGRLLVKIPGHDNTLSAGGSALWSSSAWVEKGVKRAGEYSLVIEQLGALYAEVPWRLCGA